MTSDNYQCYAEFEEEKMGKIKSFDFVKVFIGMLLSQPKEVEKIKADLAKVFGRIDFTSDLLPFNYSNYYSSEMGQNLFKLFVSFEKLINPEKLADLKIKSNKIEDKYAVAGKRTLNLDPGCITAHNLMLLTTKNFAHRIPLQKGIYAEVTYLWENKMFKDLPWTYPDFRSNQYKEILTKIRKIYLSAIS